MSNSIILNSLDLDDCMSVGGGSAPGGGSTPSIPDFPIIGDGKTYLYIKIASPVRMNVPLQFSQTVANGVTIDWGDGSALQTIDGTGFRSTTHKYATAGNYRIALNVADECTMKFGGDYLRSVIGYEKFPYISMLWAVELGKNLEITGYAFNSYSGLKSVVFFGEMQGIGDKAFQNCPGLQHVALPDSIQNIGKSAFNSCQGLASIIFSKNITEILASGCGYNLGIALLDFSSALAVPVIQSDSFSSAPSDCKIVVPDALYDEWIAATNWSTYASKIIKKSEWDASQTA